MAEHPKVFKPVTLIWLAAWIFASWMLYRQWKNGSPWPIGAFMPF